MTTHHWVRAELRRDRVRAIAALDVPPVLATVDAHRRLRGPYTAAGSLLRAIGPDLLRRCPELGPRHHIEILTAAPEFAGRVPPIAGTLAQQADSGTRTRYQARLHTLRVAHGIVDVVRDYLAAAGGGPRTLVVDNLHEADPTDLEFVSVLLRRLAPEALTVVLGTASAELPASAEADPSRAAYELTRTVDAAPGGDAAPGADSAADGDDTESARRYVDSDGTSDDPRLRRAYASMDPARRAELHDRRAAELDRRDEPSLRWGAMTYHAERGTDPAHRGAPVLRAAQIRCKDLGLYHAAADLGLRGRALVEGSGQDDLWWAFTGDVTTSLSAVGRAEQAEELYEQVRAISTDPRMHMHAAYGTAMLYARHFGEQRRDIRRARRWLNLAAAIASLLPDPKESAFYSVFHRNGLALVETRHGRFDEALRLLNEGMARLDETLAPGEQLLHRTGLRYNRAQVLGMMRRLDEALADYSAVIEVDPHFHDHYFNRGNILRGLGRTAEAIADYERALALSPPFPEAYYNRGDALLELGDVDAALADFDRVVELDPGHVDALLNRAALRAESGDGPGAWADLRAGLAVAPDNAHLRCLEGRLLADRGEPAAAREALEAAVRADPTLADAWALLGELAYDEGDPLSAVRHLDRALELAGLAPTAAGLATVDLATAGLADPAGAAELLFNRGLAYEAAGRPRQAIADYDAVLGLTGDPAAEARRRSCLDLVG